MRRTILVLALAFLAFVAVASVTDPAARNNNGETKSRFYYVVHPYVAWSTYTVTPVYYYRPTVVVYPVYHVYPVYTYQYWYNRLAGPKEPPQQTSQQQLIQGQGTQVEKSGDLKK